jgi:hypothetical protein
MPVLSTRTPHLELERPLKQASEEGGFQPEKDVNMAVSVDRTLRQALTKLEVERTHVDRQIAALRLALGLAGGNGAPTAGLNGHRAGRRPMSAAARKAVSARMKAYWASRRAVNKKRAGPK